MFLLGFMMHVCHKKVFLPNLHGKVKFSYGLSIEQYSLAYCWASKSLGRCARRATALRHNSRFKKETTHTTNSSPHTTADKKNGRKNSLDLFFQMGDAVLFLAQACTSCYWTETMYVTGTGWLRWLLLQVDHFNLCSHAQTSMNVAKT